MTVAFVAAQGAPAIDPAALLIVMLVSDGQLVNAVLSIVTIVDGKSILVNLIHELKALDENLDNNLNSQSIIDF